MKHLLRQAIEYMPAPLPVLLQDSLRYVRYGKIRHRRKIHNQILQRLESRNVVAQGPFCGMRYISSAFCSEILPKLVGTYEKETNTAVEVICDEGCDRIVDIGAAEGYYAVGMALRNPEAIVIGFEMSSSARYYLRRLARLNGVSERLRVQGICTIESLARAMEGATKPALICDCEGAEDFLLEPGKIEPLQRAFILVETHDGLKTESGVLKGITDRLCERFNPTHHVTIIRSCTRTTDNLPNGICLTPEEAKHAMDEGRPHAQWLFMSPRTDVVNRCSIQL